MEKHFFYKGKNIKELSKDVLKEAIKYAEETIIYDVYINDRFKIFDIYDAYIKEYKIKSK